MAKVAVLSFLKEKSLTLKETLNINLISSFPNENLNLTNSKTVNILWKHLLNILKIKTNLNYILPLRALFRMR